MREGQSRRREHGDLEESALRLNGGGGTEKVVLNDCIYGDGEGTDSGRPQECLERY